MPNIETLVPDIYAVLADRSGPDLALDQWVLHGANMAEHIRKATIEQEARVRPLHTLYASEIGQKCQRKLWYKVWSPSDAAPLPAWTKFKFLYGNLIEETLLALAKSAGHDVRGEQEPVEVELYNGWKVRGRMDAIIDGHVVDVKSMSPYGFADLKQGLTYETDKFGYLAQVDFYAKTQEDPKQGYVLGADKVNGHILLSPLAPAWASQADMFESLTNQADKIATPTPPARGFSDEPIGAKGNRGLCTECSYCDFKKTCWPEVRTFAYAKGPVFLTVVKDEPKVPEVV